MITQILPKMIQLINTGSTNIANANLSIDPYATGTIINDFQSVEEGTHNIPAGKIRVDVYNEGNGNITVNGDTVNPGQHWQSKAFSDPARQKIDYTPAVVIIVPANGFASYSFDGPSA